MIFGAGKGLLVRRKYAYAPPKAGRTHISTSTESSKLYAFFGYGYVLFFIRKKGESGYCVLFLLVRENNRKKRKKKKYRN